MGSYTPTIGLEIHAELKTRTKMFCQSANDPHAAEPNTHICPVCMGFPGTLPVINEKAVLHVLKVGTALGGTLADFTEFDRKNYFYPDLSKGYQISQYQFPLVSGGTLAGVAVTRMHLEEDTARSQHADNHSLIDYNRAGVPLMELVTEPVIHDAKTASTFAQELQLLLRTLGVSDANMERGEMRVEANISVMKTEIADERRLNAEGTQKLGTKVEVKNLNSFRSVERAIEYEIKRHIALLEKGETQETRGWDENKQSTFSQRLKEESHDYRYFPDPDLPKLRLSRIPEMLLENIVRLLPELPWLKRTRLNQLGFKSEDTEILLKDALYAQFFDEEIAGLGSEEAKIAVNYLMSDVRGSQATKEKIGRLKGGPFQELIFLVSKGEVTSRGAKDILIKLLSEGGSPKEIAEREGLLQVHDAEIIRKAVKGILERHPDAVEQIRAGKEAGVKFLMGQALRENRALNPKELEKYIREGVQA
jgi:aspartyl-tRNA(Asn)/glutamyl-tRNA(Gln) amidotransferase subunit B